LTKPNQASARPARVFCDFLWSAKDSWPQRRRVIGKEEWTRGEGNPGFIVTSLKPARALYEHLYCARGGRENRIKKCQLDLFADRTSASMMRAKHRRLWFASFASVLLAVLRRIGLARSRLKLLKIGAQVRLSVRRIKVAMASAYAYAEEFALAHARIHVQGSESKLGGL
jgi:hypothetical protein